MSDYENSLLSHVECLWVAFDKYAWHVSLPDGRPCPASGSDGDYGGCECGYIAARVALMPVSRPGTVTFDGESAEWRPAERLGPDGVD